MFDAVRAVHLVNLAAQTVLHSALIAAIQGSKQLTQEEQHLFQYLLDAHGGAGCYSVY